MTLGKKKQNQNQKHKQNKKENCLISKFPRSEELMPITIFTHS